VVFGWNGPAVEGVGLRGLEGLTGCLDGKNLRLKKGGKPSRELPRHQLQDLRWESKSHKRRGNGNPRVKPQNRKRKRKEKLETSPQPKQEKRDTREV